MTEELIRFLTTWKSSGNCYRQISKIDLTHRKICASATHGIAVAGQRY